MLPVDPPRHSSPIRLVPYIFGIEPDQVRRRLRRWTPHAGLIWSTYRRTGSVADATGLTPARVAARVPAAARAPVASAAAAVDRAVLVALAVPRRLGRSEEPPAPAPPPVAAPRSITLVTWGDRPGSLPQLGQVPGSDPGPTDPRVERVHLEVADGPSLLAAIRASTTDLVGLLPSTARPLDATWLVRLAGHVAGEVGAATPLLAHPRRPLRLATPDDGRTRARGLRLVDAAGEPRLEAAASGLPLAAVAACAPEAVDAAPAAGLVLDRAAVVAAVDAAGPTGAGALPADIDTAAADLTLGLRLGGRTVLAVPDVIVVDHGPVDRLGQLATPIDHRSDDWRGVVGRRGPALRRALGDERLAIAITTAASSEKVATRWGDWHLAEALARPLRDRGHGVAVQTADHRDDLAGRSADVHVVMRGVQAVRRTTGQRHVLWIISHPEQVTDAELAAADLVLVASTRFAAELAGRTATPVEVFLQATDHHRFRPLPIDPALAHPVVVVAKTRDVLRPVVADALAAGLRPTIYGSGWDAFVDPRLIAADHVRNADLPKLYSSAGILLNDHWTSMRERGFVSNRIFDGLACGTPIISDHLPEIPELFGDAVATYSSIDELREVAAAVLADPDGARTRAAGGRQVVLAGHTMEHRAVQLLDLLDRYGLTSVGGSIG